LHGEILAKFILGGLNSVSFLGLYLFRMLCNNKRAQLHANRELTVTFSSFLGFLHPTRQMKSCEARPIQDKVSTIVYIRERAKV